MEHGNAEVPEIKPNGKKVAIVGAGLQGSCAGDLLPGYDVPFSSPSTNPAAS